MFVSLRMSCPTRLVCVPSPSKARAKSGRKLGLGLVTAKKSDQCQQPDARNSANSPVKLAFLFTGHRDWLDCYGTPFPYTSLSHVVLHCKRRRRIFSGGMVSSLFPTSNSLLFYLPLPLLFGGKWDLIPRWYCVRKGYKLSQNLNLKGKNQLPPFFFLFPIFWPRGWITTPQSRGTPIYFLLMIPYQLYFED